MTKNRYFQEIEKETHASPHIMFPIIQNSNTERKYNKTLRIKVKIK